MEAFGAQDSEQATSAQVSNASGLTCSCSRGTFACFMPMKLQISSNWSRLHGRLRSFASENT